MLILVSTFITIIISIIINKGNVKKCIRFVSENIEPSPPKNSAFISILTPLTAGINFNNLTFL